MRRGLIQALGATGDNDAAVVRAVQLKQDQALIQAGPYGTIRHPIYTGLLLLFPGNAVMIGDPRGLLAVAIVFASFWRKLRLEEKWLGEHFGAAYQEYPVAIPKH